jgi:hypothetical protein
MRLQRPKQLVPLALGLLVLVLAAACSQQAGLVGSADAPSLGLHDLTRLARQEVVLMSCADDAAREPLRSTWLAEPSGESAPSPEPLWCANPDSPHCLPGTPVPGHNDSWLGPISVFVAPHAIPPSGPAYCVAPGWPAPLPAQLVSYARGHRLERPPRHS